MSFTAMYYIIGNYFSVVSSLFDVLPAGVFAHGDFILSSRSSKRYMVIVIPHKSWTNPRGLEIGSSNNAEDTEKGIYQIQKRKRKGDH
jgi:hypothetical protein